MRRYCKLFLIGMTTEVYSIQYQFASLAYLVSNPLNTHLIRVELSLWNERGEEIEPRLIKVDSIETSVSQEWQKGVERHAPSHLNL